MTFLYVYGCVSRKVGFLLISIERVVFFFFARSSKRIIHLALGGHIGSQIKVGSHFLLVPRLFTAFHISLAATSRKLGGLAYRWCIYIRSLWLALLFSSDLYSRSKDSECRKNQPAVKSKKRRAKLRQRVIHQSARLTLTLFALIFSSLFSPSILLSGQTIKLSTSLIKGWL